MELVEVIVVVVGAAALGVVLWSHLKPEGRKLPPGPSPLPIFGNIFQLTGPNTCESFANLSKKYGPVMSLRLGSLFTVVISSPEMAKEVLTNTDFLERPLMQAVHAHDHAQFSIAFLPVTTPKWKQLRRICQEQMFASRILEKSQPLRHQKLQELIDHVQKCCDAGRAVTIRDAAFATTLNLMSVTMFSADATELDSSVTAELRELMAGVVTVLGTPNFADFFPILKYLDPQGVRRKAHFHYGKMFDHIKSRMAERVELKKANPNHLKHDDFLEKILDISLRRDYELTIQDITHLLVDLYVAGSESTVMSIEWIMSELMLHPQSLAKLKAELRSVMGERKMIQESEDISRLPFLNAVIKETLRLHPPGPLLFPRQNTNDVELNGYFIPKGTQILVNEWAIGRDPSVWPNPESFVPERFLDKNIDYKGQDPQLVPFGSGRRICLGIPIAHRMVHSTVAALIHNFEWKFAPDGSEYNRELFSGPALRREVPLNLIPLNPSF
uniref:Cytochrome P450 CYP76AH16 n=1 Tax=Plectranthus barbatus TaxID=41228 RepID=A0A1B0VRQ2_9LAMI|nr:cytochrome P450 CYP76AH16 [Plectranthus barbatus]UPO25015.1 cytochrome P450 CYP76AH16 [synthetic construct]